MPGPLPRHPRQQALLQWVCAAAQAYGTSRSPSRTFLSFYAVLLCETLQAVPVVDEDLTALLLPHLLAGIGGAASADLRAATLMVLAQLGAKATLSDAFLSGARTVASQQQEWLEGVGVECLAVVGGDAVLGDAATCCSRCTEAGITGCLRVMAPMRTPCLCPSVAVQECAARR